MKRKLMQQMRNEWRSNLWMGIELLIVGLVLWSIFVIFGMFGYIHKVPQNFDLTDVVAGYMEVIPENASEYKPYADSLHNEWTDMKNLVAQLKNNPLVEEVGFGSNALPYNYNYSGNQLNIKAGDTIYSYAGNTRHMTPELIRLIRLRGLRGETPEQLAKIIEDGGRIISAFENSDYELDPLSLVGRQSWFGNDSSRTSTIGAVIEGIRRNDYEPLRRNNGVMIMAPQWFPGEVAIRLKPGKAREFLDNISLSDTEAGNVYFSNLRTVDNIRDTAHRDIHALTRNLTICAIFLLSVVFLGFLGAFWYKTQQRVPELALRRVNGATRGSLVRRLLSEGLILLCIASVPMLAIGGYLLGTFDFADILGTPLPSWLPWSMGACAIAALALIIAAGIWFPASKAMTVNPAEALSDQ